MTAPIDELGDLIDDVLALVATERSDPRATDFELAILDLCIAALERSGPPGPAPAARAKRSDLGEQIAELAAEGKGVRAIARALGVAPSTVSRRLRRLASPKS